MTYLTLIDALRAQSAQNQGITYIRGDQDSRYLSYQALWQRALVVLHHFQAKGIAPDSELILLHTDNEPLVDAFWACLLGRLRPVPVAVSHNDDHRYKVLRVFEQLPQGFLYTNRKVLERLQVFAQAQGFLDLFARMKSRCLLLEDMHHSEQPGQIQPVSPEDIALIQFSSGSTGQPKGVTLTHRNLLTNIQAIISASQMTHNDSMLGWMPLTHDMGIIGFHITPLVCNINQCLMPTDLFIRRPQLWIQKASELGITLLSSPNFGYQHLMRLFKPDNNSTLDLSKIRLIYNGAEPISVSICRHFTAQMADYGLRASAMYPVYGLAEASLAVTFPTPGHLWRAIYPDRQSLGLGAQVTLLAPDDPNSLPLVSVGKPVPDCQVQISDAQGAALPEHRVGRVLIRGGAVTGGYYQNPEATAAVLDADGWLDTGDLGFIDQGELVISGRIKDLIILHGQNYYPHDLEALCLACVDLDAGKIAVCGVRAAEAATDAVIVFVVFKGEIAAFLPIAQAIRQHLNQQTGLAVSAVLPVNQLPKTTSGKVQRYLLAQRYQAGEFAAVSQALEALRLAVEGTAATGAGQIQPVLLEICRRVISQRTIGLTDNFFDLGISSLDLVQIHEQIDAAYPDLLALSDLLEHPTISALADCLAAKQADQDGD